MSNTTEFSPTTPGFWRKIEAPDLRMIYHKWGKVLPSDLMIVNQNLTHGDIICFSSASTCVFFNGESYNLEYAGQNANGEDFFILYDRDGKYYIQLQNDGYQKQKLGAGFNLVFQVEPFSEDKNRKKLRFELYDDYVKQICDLFETEPIKAAIFKCDSLSSTIHMHIVDHSNYVYGNLFQYKEAYPKLKQFIIENNISCPVLPMSQLFD